MKSQLILPIFIFLFISCIKKSQVTVVETKTDVNKPLTEGLPENFTGCDGYLYYSNIQNTSAFAFFTDPRKNMTAAFDHTNNFQINKIANISVGEVKCYGQALQTINNGLNEFSYSGFGVGNMGGHEVTWSIAGNSTFEGFSVILPKGTPILRSSELPTRASRSKELIVDLGPVVVEFDSVVAVLITSEAQIKKVSASGHKQIVFTAAEINKTFRDVNFGQISIHAFNYSHFTKKNKLYIFECESSAMRDLQVDN